MNVDPDVRSLPSYAAGEIQVPWSVRSFGEQVRNHTHWHAHSHPTHELLWNQQGISHATVGERTWTISPVLGLWMPAGVEHSGSAPSGTWYRSTHFQVGFASLAGQPVAVEITPLLRLLLERLSEEGLSQRSRTATEALVLDVMEPSNHAILVHVPNAEVLQPLVSALLSNPGDPRTLADWGSELGVSTRTITRAFERETGHGFSRWVAAVRAQRAAQLLGAGELTHDVMEEVGYRSQSAFGAAFKRVTGFPPSAFVLSESR